MSVLYRSDSTKMIELPHLQVNFVTRQAIRKEPVSIFNNVHIWFRSMATINAAMRLSTIYWDPSAIVAIARSTEILL